VDPVALSVCVLFSSLLCVSLCRGNESSVLQDEASANGFDAAAEIFSDAFVFKPSAKPSPSSMEPFVGLLPRPCLTTAGFTITPLPSGPGPCVRPELAASLVLDVLFPPPTGTTSETAPYQDVLWNPAVVPDAARTDRAGPAVVVGGPTALSMESTVASCWFCLGHVELAPEVVRPGAELTIAGVSTALAVRTGDPGVGAPGGGF